MTDLIGIAYFSRPVRFAFDDIRDILSVSQRRNLEVGITGALLYNNRHYLQWLEGEPSEIRAVFNRIANDRRHCDVTLLSARALKSRRFPAWSMAAAVTNDETLRGLRLVPNVPLTSFNPADWTSLEVDSFSEVLSNYLARRPAQISKSPIKADRESARPMNALFDLDQILSQLCGPGHHGELSFGNSL